MDGQDFISQHRAELISFYAPYFDADEELKVYLDYFRIMY